MTRIFEVELEHTRLGINWDKKRVEARTAVEAIKKAEVGEASHIRAVGVILVAETNA